MLKINLGTKLNLKNFLCQKTKEKSRIWCRSTKNNMIL